MQYSFPSRSYQDHAAARQARKPDHCYLPWQKKCATSYVSYLQKRGISTAVIKRCTQLGILYEGSYRKKEPDGNATYIPVCVFVGKDEHGTATGFRWAALPMLRCLHFWKGTQRSGMWICIWTATMRD